MDFERLTKETLKETAREILIAAWEDGSEIPDKVTMQESDTGEIEFVINIDDGILGRAKVVYSPQIWVEAFIANQERLFIKLVEEYPDKAVQLEKVRLELQDEIDQTTAILLKSCYSEFFHAIIGHPVLAEKLFLDARLEKLKYDPSCLKSFGDTKKMLSKMDRQKFKERERIVNQVRNDPVSPQITFSIFYEEELNHWWAVKDFYTANKKFSNVIELAKLAFPAQPPHLVEKIGLKGASTPSHLALQSAALIVGVPPKIKAIRSLQKYLKESDDLRQSASKEEIKAAKIENQITPNSEFCGCPETRKFEVTVENANDFPGLASSVLDSCDRCGKVIDKQTIHIVGVEGNPPPADFKEG
jgi:hypothetical protein